MQKLYDDRSARLTRGEGVFNSNLIDLFVKKNGILSEIYEVKTFVDRQTLYTAIGQIVAHASENISSIAKFLVIPVDEDIPDDLKQAIAVLGIKTRHFRIRGADLDKTVELL